MDVQSKRILHIMSSYGGGISTFINNLARSAPQVALVFDVVTYTPVAESFRKAIETTGGQIYQLANPKNTSWSAFVKSYKQAFLDHSYDAVYCHISGYRSLAYYLLTRYYQWDLGDNFYIHAHFRFQKEAKSFKAFLSQKLDQWINRSLSRLPVGCSHLAIKDLFGLNDAQDRVVIPNSIEPRDFVMPVDHLRANKEKWQACFPSANDRQILIGQIGRLTPIKNHPFTLDLVKWSQSQAQPLRLIIAGEGEELFSLKALCQKMGISDQVYYAGRVSPIADLMVSLDALVMPSFAEGFGTVAIEAQAAGVPVLASQAVTQEVDLGLGLIHHLDLGQDLSVWYDKLIQMVEFHHAQPVDGQARIQNVEERAFSNQSACRIYRQLIDHQLQNFQLD